MLYYPYRTTFAYCSNFFLIFACKKFDISKYTFSYVGCQRQNTTTYGLKSWRFTPPTLWN